MLTVEEIKKEKDFAPFSIFFKNGKKVKGLYIDARIRQEDLKKAFPDKNLYVYSFRSSDDGDEYHSELALSVFVNHSGSFITDEKLDDVYGSIWFYQDSESKDWKKHDPTDEFDKLYGDYSYLSDEKNCSIDQFFN